jgi:tRNA-Thr(GGU) m(6)t(6)A37 methyltransferase TsaA
MMTFEPVAYVRNSRTIPTDDFWGNVVSDITLADHLPDDAFAGIENLSHLEIIYHFDRVEQNKIVFSGHPRGNPAYPLTGIFAQRKKDRPNAIGLCTVELVEHSGRSVKVKFLDAIDGTPVLDIKPVFREFLPQGQIKQSDWVSDLMKKYWKP